MYLAKPCSRLGPAASPAATRPPDASFSLFKKALKDRRVRIHLLRRSIETMSDESSNTEKGLFTKEEFEQELFRTYDRLSKQRLQWTRQKVNEVLDFVQEKQLPWNNKKINETLRFIVDNQMPEYLQEYPGQYWDATTQHKNTSGYSEYHSSGGRILRFAPGQYYDVLKKIHLATNHGNYDKMVTHIKEKNWFIPSPPIITFVKLCKQCQSKNMENKPKVNLPKLPPKPGVVNLIDLQVNPAEHFKWVLHYCDLNTKCSLLLPLTSIRTEEVATALINGFMKIGCPTLLYSDGSNLMTEAYKDVITRRSLYNDIKLLHCHQSVMDRINEDIMKLIQDWLVENDSMSWSFGIYYIQHKVNCGFDEAMLKASAQAFSEEQLSTSKKEPSNPIDVTEEDGATSLDVKDGLKTEDKTNTNDDTLANALVDLNIALSE